MIVTGSIGVLAGIVIISLICSGVCGPKNVATGHADDSAAIPSVSMTSPV